MTLCLSGLLILGVGTFFDLDPSTRTILDYADNVVFGLFLLDFATSFLRAPRKTHYLLTGGGSTFSPVSPRSTHSGGDARLA